jgi:hypothetical protein
MDRLRSSAFFRSILSTAIAVIVIVALESAAAAAVVNVNCNLRGRSIGGALGAHAKTPDLVLVVAGTCTENVVITRDDVTIRTNGTPASVVAADSSLSAITLDAAHRIVIDGLVANGIAVSGGTFGIAATRGSSLDVANCAVSGASNTGIISSLQQRGFSRPVLGDRECDRCRGRQHRVGRGYEQHGQR